MFSPKRILYVLAVLFGVSFHMGAQNSVISFDNDNNNRKIDVLIDGDYSRVSDILPIMRNLFYTRSIRRKVLL